MIPKGVKIYGSGRIKAKAGQEIPVVLKSVKGIDDRIKKAGEKFQSKSGKKADEKKSFGSNSGYQAPLSEEKDK